MEILIADNGVGFTIPTSQLTHPFITTKAYGMGLGLHIVKRYLELLNGTAELKSEISKGTEITIKIPINLS